MKTFYRWARENSLWLVSIGLMLASSGLDGVYMGKWMPIGWAWLGLVLNTMSDVGNMVLMYWYGRLKQQPKGSLRYRLAGALLPAELVAILYSWFFSWRQLRAILPGIEPADWRWVSAVAAGFIPLLLAFIGYAQSLLAGKLEIERAEPMGERAIVAKPAIERATIPLIADVSESEPAYCCDSPGCSRTFATQAALNAHKRAHTNGNHRHEPAEELATNEN